MIFKNNKRTKYKRLLYLILLFINSVLFSQRTASQEVNLNGFVYYAVDSIGLEGVNVLLYKNGQFEKGDCTDSKGQFEIKQVPLGVYELRLTIIGMKEKIIEQFNVDSILNNIVFYYPDPCKLVKECPYGHTNNLVRIIYGLPTKRTMRKAKRGKVRLGGCIVSDCDPHWYCKIHDIEF